MLKIHIDIDFTLLTSKVKKNTSLYLINYYKN